MLSSLRALTHPAWLAALVLLIVNDHYLKGSGLLPGWMTGKLSDVVGLFAAPAVLAALLAVRTRRGGLAAHVATGVVFTAIKISAPFARWVEAVSTYTPFPWRITVDPTDLLALPALVIGYVAWREVTGRAPVNGERERFSKVVAAIGGLACMATAPPPETGVQTPRPTPGSLALGNGTGGARLFRVRHLKETVQLDCARVAQDPTTTLSRELFADAEAWLVDPGRAVILETPPLCDAVLVDGDGVPMTLVFWSAAEFPTVNMTSMVSSITTDRLVSFDFVDHGVTVSEHPAVFDPPPAIDPEPVGACAVPSAELGVAWSLPLPPELSQTIVEIVTSPDGCTALELDGAPTFYVCVPEGALPFEVGDQISIRPGIPAPYGAPYPEVSGQLSAETLDIAGETKSVRIVRGNYVARSESTTAPFEVAVEEVAGCGTSHDECGSHLAPVEVSVYGDGVPEITFLRSGDSVVLDDGSRLTLARAAASAAVDFECTPWTSGPYYFESVITVDAETEQ